MTTDDATTRRWRPGAGTALVVLLLVLGGWRAANHATPEQGRAAHRPPLAARSVGPARLELPAAWARIDGARDHATWAGAAREHTVTLGIVEASSAPLLAVVRSAAQQAGSALPGARVVRGPQEVELPSVPRGDSALVVELSVAPPPDQPDARPLQVRQVWRRDTASGLDMVATWTSADGRWPVDPAASVPGSRLR